MSVFKKWVFPEHATVSLRLNMSLYNHIFVFAGDQDVAAADIVTVSAGEYLLSKPMPYEQTMQPPPGTVAM